MSTLCATDGNKWGANQWVDEGKALVDVKGVRRLTPTECERLMGFPDGYTGILADSNRYKVLGNSIVTNCLLWIGKRLQDRV
jgi:DNA (cytosine-5)-methyltransferase 1